MGNSVTRIEFDHAVAIPQCSNSLCTEIIDSKNYHYIYLPVLLQVPLNVSQGMSWIKCYIEVGLFGKVTSINFMLMRLYMYSVGIQCCK